MSLRWCAFTGALMLVLVLASAWHWQSAQDPRGVTTRWWDGTRDTVEYYRKGKLAMRYGYGDDGTTVISYEQYSEDGHLTLLKTRRYDGKIEESHYLLSENKNRLSEYWLWNPDGKVALEYRSYRPSGMPYLHKIWSDDGSTLTYFDQFLEDGRLYMTVRLLPNADHETCAYVSGALRRKDVQKANGDQETYEYYGSGELFRTSKTSRLTNVMTQEVCSKTGQILMQSHEDPHSGTLAFNSFKNGKLRLRQSLLYGQLTCVQEFSSETGRCITEMEIAPGTQTVLSVKYFRNDGTLLRKKVIDQDGNVARQLDYDISGRTQVAELPGDGKADIDRALLVLPTFDELANE